MNKKVGAVTLSVMVVLGGSTLAACGKQKAVELSSETCLMMPNEELRRQFADYERQNLGAVKKNGQTDAQVCVVVPDDDPGEYETDWIGRGHADFPMMATIWGGANEVSDSGVVAYNAVPQYLAIQLLTTVSPKDVARWVYADGDWGRHVMTLPPGGGSHSKKKRPSVVATTRPAATAKTTVRPTTSRTQTSTRLGPPATQETPRSTTVRRSTSR